jgi:hypothetical protein
MVPLLLFSKSKTVDVPEYDDVFEKSQYKILFGNVSV